MDDFSDQIDGRDSFNIYATNNFHKKGFHSRISDFDRAVRKERRSEKDYILRKQQKETFYQKLKELNSVYSGIGKEDISKSRKGYLIKKKKTKLQLKFLEKARKLKQYYKDKNIENELNIRKEHEFINKTIWKNITLENLKAKLKENNLSTKGRKYELIKRIKENKINNS